MRADSCGAGWCALSLQGYHGAGAAGRLSHGLVGSPLGKCFYSDKGLELPHIHVDYGKCKVWLQPVRLARVENVAAFEAYLTG